MRFDFYGYEAFQKMVEFLNHQTAENQYSLMGYQVGNTLSKNGSVSRAVCEVDANGNLTEIIERTKIYSKEGNIVYEEDGKEIPIDASALVSMNFWAFTPTVFPAIEKFFVDFVLQNLNNPTTEFFIPLIADHLIKNNIATFKVIPTTAKWFGVTYKEDKEIVQKNINDLINDGIYPVRLW